MYGRRPDGRCVACGHARLFGVDMAKVIALVIVLLTHTELDYRVSFVDNMSLPVFWICAGYTTLSDISLRSKAVKLILPYFVMSLLCLAFAIFYRQEPFVWDNIVGILYARAFFYPLNPGVDNTFIMSVYNSVLWFLPSMFTAYCLYKCILKVRGVRMQALICAICLLVMYLLTYLPLLLPWSVDTAFLCATHVGWRDAATA